MSSISSSFAGSTIATIESIPSSKDANNRSSLSSSSSAAAAAAAAAATTTTTTTPRLLSYQAPGTSTNLRLSLAAGQLDMGKLRFDRLGTVYGRNVEKTVLDQALQRLVQGAPLRRNDDQTELLLVAGVSGCGKTTLIKHMAKAVKKAKGLLVHGKFDLILQAEPYAGIKTACLQLCGELLRLRNSSKTKFATIRDAIEDVMGSELGLLMDFVPELQDVMHDESSFNATQKESAPTSTTIGVTEGSKLQLHEAFKRFVRLISSQFAPFCLALDDLQRADSASLELLRAVASDVDNTSGLLLMGTYRSNEIYNDHPLVSFINDVKEVANEEASGFGRLTEIPLDNFDENELNEILMILLNVDDPNEVSNLASICYKRTLGNMFYLDCFLQTLREKKLLEFSLASYKWQWNEDDILASTIAAENVVDLIRSRLIELPKATQRRLSFAACLGTSFDMETENVVWETLKDGEAADDWSTIAEEHGILERMSDMEYRWVHDQVQSAALSLISEEERPKTNTCIGRALLDRLPNEKQDANLFTIVDLLNSGEQKGGEKFRLEMAELNRLATDKASRQVGLETIDHYANIGIQHLPDDTWHSHYKLALELHSHAAEAAHLLGKRELLQARAGRILDQVSRPILDKVRVYKALIMDKSSQAEMEGLAAAREMLFDVLLELGVGFPRSTPGVLFATVKSLLRIKRKVKTLSESGVIALPWMEDPVQLEVMEIMTTFFGLVFQAAPKMMGLLILQLVEKTFEHGIGPHAPPAFGQLGMLFTVMNDHDTGVKCGILAEKMSESFNFKRTNAHVSYLVCAWPLSFARPYRQLIPKLVKGFRDGLAVGDVGSVASCIVFYSYMCFIAGFSLKTVEADCRRYCLQIKRISTNVVQNVPMVWQCTLNLLGRSADPSELSGEVIPDLESFESLLTIESNASLLPYVQCCVYAVLGFYEKGAELALANEYRMRKVGPGLFINMHDTFIRGLCLFAMARKTKQQKYKVAAKRALGAIKKWARKGNPNVLHYEKLFEAELKALNGKLDAAELLYHRALNLATRSGFLHDAAIANERCADFFRHVRKSKEDALYKMEEACKLYEEWGCRIKVDMLRKEYEPLQTMPPESHVIACSSDLRF